MTPIKGSEFGEVDYDYLKSGFGVVAVLFGS